MKIIVILGLGLFLAACGRGEDSTDTSEAVKFERNIDAMQISRGEKVFSQNCASCHGDEAQGDPDWRTRDKETGRFPPPPLDGTAHAWHHPLAQLKHVIANGSPGGKGNMPAWSGKLSEQEMDDTIAWFQAKWPAEVYAAWAEINQRASQR